MDTIEWNELLAVLVGYPSDTLHATLEIRGRGDPEAHYEVWRQGRKLRVEMNGAPAHICDGETRWSFREAAAGEGAEGRPVRQDAGTTQYLGPAQGLCAPRQSQDWQQNDFTVPEGAVTVEDFQGGTAGPSR